MKYNSRKGFILIPTVSGLIPSEGFDIGITVGWKTLTFEFIPGNKAGQLLIAMGQASPESRAIFSAVGEEVISEGGSIVMVINNIAVDPRRNDNWPDNWRQLSLSLRSPYIETESDLAIDNRLEEYLFRWVSIFLSMVLPLLPLEDRRNPSEEEAYLESLPEGARTEVTVNRYERTRANREACVSFYGAKCQACGFDFGHFYGPLGDGYIEVHHRTPLSEIGREYLVNPIRDLVPLCGNCHAMIHRRSPALSVEELRGILREEATSSAVQTND